METDFDQQPVLRFDTVWFLVGLNTFESIEHAHCTWHDSFKDSDNCKSRIAKPKLAVWLAIEERVLSVEFHLCMKRCCWRESQAKSLKNLKALLSYFSHQFTEKFQSLYFVYNFCNCEVLTGFLQILYLISERLKFSFRLRIFRR